MYSFVFLYVILSIFLSNSEYILSIYYVEKKLLWILRYLENRFLERASNWIFIR